MKTFGFLVPDVQRLVADFNFVATAWRQRGECSPADIVGWREAVLDVVDLPRQRALDEQAYVAAVIQMCRTWAALASRERERAA